MNFALGLSIAGALGTLAAAWAARSLRSFSRHRLEEVARRAGHQNRLAEILLQHERTAVAAEALQVIATATLICGAVSLDWQSMTGQPSSVQLIVAAIAGALLLLLLEVWLPHALARIWAEPFLDATWPFWKLLTQLLYPVIFGERIVDVIVHRFAGRQPQPPTEETFEDEIRTIVTEGHREGLLEEDAREMIEGIIELRDADVSQIMTPRTDVVSMPLRISLPKALRIIIDSGHTRIPTFDRNRDDIVGILYAKDLLPELAKGTPDQDLDLSTLVRQPYFVPETKRVDDLLQEFQRTRNHMAIVLDEYGGVSGLVTIEDALEEIVGEIVDEYDEDIVDGIKQIDERTSEVLARVHIDEINQRLHLSLAEDGDFDTLGGFVFSSLGRVPNVGDSLVVGNVKLTVIDVSRRRIERVRIELLDEVPKETA
ncbi:MAG: hemolysin family protein [Pirellulales bacterium]|nr:hemolysin family protein [Pirellulales bacterium]